MKMDGMLTGWKSVQVKLKADTRSLLPQGDGAYGFALCVLEFDFGFSCAGERENNQSAGGG